MELLVLSLLTQALMLHSTIKAPAVIQATALISGQLHRLYRVSCYHSTVGALAPGGYFSLLTVKPLCRSLTKSLATVCKGNTVETNPQHTEVVGSVETIRAASDKFNASVGGRSSPTLTVR